MFQYSPQILTLTPEMIFPTGQLQALINSKAAAFKTTWKVLLYCSTMIGKVMNVFAESVVLCWDNR